MRPGQAKNEYCMIAIETYSRLGRFLSRNVPPGLSSRPVSLLRQPAHKADVDGLPLREGERESGAS